MSRGRSVTIQPLAAESKVLEVTSNERDATAWRGRREVTSLYVRGAKDEQCRLRGKDETATRSPPRLAWI